MRYGQTKSNTFSRTKGTEEKPEKEVKSLNKKGKIVLQSHMNSEERLWQSEQRDDNVVDISFFRSVLIIFYFSLIVHVHERPCDSQNVTCKSWKGNYYNRKYHTFYFSKI